MHIIDEIKGKNEKVSAIIMKMTFVLILFYLYILLFN